MQSPVGKHPVRAVNPLRAAVRNVISSAMGLSLVAGALPRR